MWTSPHFFKEYMVNDSIYIKFTKEAGCDLCCQPDWSNKDWIYLPTWSNPKLRWNRLNKSSQDTRHQVVWDKEPKRWEKARWAPAYCLERAQAEVQGGEQSGTWQTLRVEDLGVQGDQGSWTLQGRVQERKEQHREKNSGNLQRVPRISVTVH